MADSPIILPKNTVLTFSFFFDEKDVLSYNVFYIGVPIPIDTREYYKTTSDLKLYMIDNVNSSEVCNTEAIFSSTILQKHLCDRYNIITDLDNQFNNPDGYINKNDLSIIIFDKNHTKKISYEEAEQLLFD